MTTDRDELRQLAKQLLDYNTCHDGVVDQAAEAIPTLLDQLAATESRVTRLREALQPFAEWAKGMQLDYEAAGWTDDTRLAPSRLCTVGPTFGHCRSALRVLEETANGT